MPCSDSRPSRMSGSFKYVSHGPYSYATFSDGRGSMSAPNCTKIKDEPNKIFD